MTAHDYRSVASWYPRVATAAGEDLEVMPWTELDTFLASYLSVQDGFALIFMVVVFSGAVLWPGQYPGHGSF